MIRRLAGIVYMSSGEAKPSHTPEPKARAPKGDSQIERLFPVYDELDLEGHNWRELKPGKRLQKVGELYKKKYGRDEQLGRDTERTAFVRHTVKHPAAPLRG
jgi:hypothetical protein